MNLWDAAAAQPSFVSHGAPLHPLSGFLPVAVLIPLGIISSWLMLRRYMTNQTRGNWVLLTIVLAIAILGDPYGIAVVATLLFSRRHIAAVSAAVITAILLTPFYWLPSLQLRREPPRDSSAAPRDAFVQALIVEPDRDRTSLRLRNLADLNRAAIVDHVPGKITRMGGSSELQSGWRFLVTRHRWWPGWRVYWNGERLPPVIANAGYVGTFVPPGTGTLRFRYRPDGFDDGLRLSLAGVLLLLIGAMAGGDWIARGLEKLRNSAAEPAAVRRAGRPRPTGAAVLTTIAFVAYSALLIHHRVRVSGGADSSGYLNGAKLWSRGDLIVPLTLPAELDTPAELDGLFIPLGFHRGPQPRTMVPGYPPGTSLHMAALRLVGGDGAMSLFAPLIAIAGIVLMFFLARSLGVPKNLAVAGTVILAASPLVIYYSLLQLSDLAAMTYAILAMAASFRAREDHRWGFLAGAAVGMDVLIRPTQVLLIPAMIVAMRARRRPLLAATIGGLPFLVAQMVITSILYGSAFRTSYGDLSYLFAIEHFPARFIHYSWWLALLFTPLVFPAALGALGLRRIDGWTRAALAVWFTALLIFHCFYEPYGDWAASRFILPGVPALIALLLLGTQSMTKRIAMIWIAVAFIAIHGAVQTRRLNVLHANEAEQVYLESVKGAQPLLPPGHIVIAGELSGALFYYTGSTAVRYDWMSPATFEALRQRSGDRPWYALLAQFEAGDALGRTTGKWVPLAKFRDVTLFQLSEPRAPGAAGAPR